MLILTRKVGESILIGDDIRITTLGIQGRQIRIGISAPNEVTVHREEIYNKIQQEKLAGAKATGVNATGVKEEEKEHCFNV